MDLKTLQRFASKTTSFSIAVPAARLKTRASFRAISSGSKSRHKPFFVAGDLLREIHYWRSWITGKVVFPGLTRDM